MIRPDPGYGTGLWPVWQAVLRDYWQGDGRRARARLGFLSPPEGRGRVIWIRAGAGVRSLRLGVELLGAIRERRRDVRLVLTFEYDDPDALRQWLRPWPKVGLGYGPCDRHRVNRRVLNRFQPCGILSVETPWPHNLLQQAGVPVIAVGGTSGAITLRQAPQSLAQLVQYWPTAGAAIDTASGLCQTLPTADPQARWVEAQADVVLRSLAATADQRLWWWHGSRSAWADWLAAWLASPLSQQDILLCSFSDEWVPSDTTRQTVQAVSQWARVALPAGSLLHLDDPRWYAAAASAVDAVHLATPSRTLYWQIMASGAPLSLAWDGPPNAPQINTACPQFTDPHAVLTDWLQLRAAAPLRRQRGDQLRRRFWQERRQVDANLEQLLSRVWTW